MAKARVQRIWTAGLLTMTALVAVTIGFSAYVTAAAYNKSKNLEPTGGEVSLRSYFQKGSGTSEDPFVISRPIHFYNLSRLQNLGVFSSQTYFVLGYDPSHPEDIHGVNPGTDLTFYKDNSSNELVTDHTLDMSKIESLTDAIASIGDEQTPFYGDFNGHGLAIKGLKVASKPEDVGVFGYTYPGSSVHDLYLIDPIVTDDGYENNVEIAPLFSDPNNVAYAGSVVWNNGQATHEVGSTPSAITSLFENAEVPFDNSTPRINITATLPNLPASMSSVNCEYRISSPLITAPAVVGNQITNLVFNKDMVTPGSAGYDPDYKAFATCQDGGTFHVRMALVASCITSAGLHYSKTLSSYLIVLIRHVDEYENASFSYQVIKDTFDGETSGYTQYRHGANIGLLCGHAEGSFTNCFVYGGTISLNNQKSGITSLLQESETGLFGEIGASVDSSISPQKNYEGDKDTGVLNFSKMYEDVAGGTHTQVNSGGTIFYKYKPGDHEEVFEPTGSSNEFHLSYLPTTIKTVEVNGSSRAYTSDGSTVTLSGALVSPSDTVSIYYESDSAEKFKAFLRNNQLSGNDRSYVTAQSNTVDFIGQRVIEDTETDKRKGMGVFSLITTASKSDDNSTYAVNELGSFVIKKDNTNNHTRTYREFYYTTAEWNADPDGDGTPEYIDIKNWNDVSDTTPVNGHYHINQPNSFPSTITSSTWNPYFERYFNYNIKCSLSASSTVNNYFYNTQSEFLKSYFSYKLVDSSGVAPSPMTAPFGVFVRDINPDTGAESPITKFDSVLEMSEEASGHFTDLKFPYTETFTGNGKDRFFELKHIPYDQVTVTVDGITNNANSTVDNQLIFNTPPADDAAIVINYRYRNPTKSVVFSIKNSGGANVTLFAASNYDTKDGGYVGIYKTSRADLYNTNKDDVTSKPDYAMYCPYYPTTETLDRSGFHYYDYDYSTGVTPMDSVEGDYSQTSRLYAHTFYLKQGEYIVASPENKAQLVYLCAQGQNGKGNTGLSQPNGLEAITDVDFIGVNSDPKTLDLQSTGELLDGSVNVRCYFSFNSIWDNTATDVAGNNDLHVITGISGDKPTIDITAGNNLTYLLADNEGRFNCSFNGTDFERQFYEYVRPTA